MRDFGSGTKSGSARAAILSAGRGKTASGLRQNRLVCNANLYVPARSA